MRSLDSVVSPVTSLRGRESVLTHQPAGERAAVEAGGVQTSVALYSRLGSQGSGEVEMVGSSGRSWSLSFLLLVSLARNPWRLGSEVS